VYSGNHFSTGITVNTTGIFFAYLEFEIEYDDTIFALDHTIGEGGIEIPFGLPIVEMENSDGMLRIKAEDPLNIKYGADGLTNYNINWVTRYGTEETKTLDLEINYLYTEDFETIGNPRGQDGTVEILIRSPLLGAGKVWANLYIRYVEINRSASFFLLMDMGTQPIDRYAIRMAYDPAIITIDTDFPGNPAVLLLKALEKLGVKLY
jgi:hypothetical protein